MEDITVEGLVKGSVVHFHRARTIVVQSSGRISATGMGNFSSFYERSLNHPCFSSYDQFSGRMKVEGAEFEMLSCMLLHRVELQCCV